MEKTVEKRLTRAEVPEELTWNLNDLFVSDSAWEEELAEIEKDVAGFSRFKGTLHTGSKALLDCLSAQEQLSIKVVKASTYAELKQSADSSDPSNQANSAKFAALQTKINSALSFIKSEILALEDGVIEKYLSEERGLNPFQKSLEKLLKQKKHQLSPETEEALAALGELQDAPYKIYEMSKLADMQFASIQNEAGNEMPVSFALYENRYEYSPDKEIRKKAYSSFTTTLNQYKNTFAAAYSTEVTKHVALAKLRHYDSATHMLLDHQQVTMEMYNNQLDTIFKELAPHMRRYAKLKKKVLGLDQMRFYDLKAPMDPDFNPKTTFEDAEKLIIEALNVMGPDYCNVIKRGFKERWVDRADNVGKSTGAFCTSPYNVHPYILITWQDNMRDVFTLAHEFGHAAHFYLANKNQRIMNLEPSMYFIEAPSTMHEMLLGRHLLSKYENDRQMRRWVVLELLGTYYHNFVTHLLEGEYQRRVYAASEAGKALTAKSLCEIKAAVLSEFWGDAVEMDEGAALTWMRQPHYYMGLYPYTYSAGLTVSTAVSQMIKEEGGPAVERWINVLKAGGTMEPLELTKAAGVDMSTPEPIRRAIAYVGSLVDELEQSYK